MFISQLELTNFRNIEKSELAFSESTNLIVGPNGAGKTNILEALYYCGTGRSFRTHFDENLIRRDTDFFRLVSEGQIDPHQVTVEVGVEPGSRKMIKVNSAPLKKLADLYQYFRLVEFSPYDLDLVIGPPSSRRRFLSLTISQSAPAHIALLSDYSKLLAQRNALLKDYQERGSLSEQMETTLAIWDENLAQSAVEINTVRAEFIAQLSPLATDFYNRISGHDEDFKLMYTPSPRLPEFTAENFAAKLKSRRRRELAMGQTLYGPHRDELQFLVKDAEARSYASQGQIKTAVLSVKLAQHQYLKDKLEQAPVMLLDEIYSDLDRKRLGFITDLLPDLGQTFVTTSKTSEINDLSIFICKHRIEGGIPTELK